MDRKFGMVALFVRDLAGARRFYTETVGLPVAEEVSGPNFVALGPLGGAFLALQDMTTFPAGLEQRPGAVEVGLEVDDVDAVYHDWRAKGVRLLNEPTDQSFGRTFQATDPEGHLLNVYRLAS